MISLVLSLCTTISVVFAEPVDKIVAVVNDDIITQSDIINFKSKLKKNGLVDEALLNMYDKKKLLTDEKMLIDYLIDEKTIDSEIRRLGLASPIEQVEAEIRNIAQSRGFDRNQLKMALKNQGVAYSDYQDFVRSSLQRQTLLQKEVTSKIKISDDEVNAYYIANFSTAKALIFEYTLAHILFLNSNGGASEAYNRAKLVSDKLAQGIPFETLAAQYSEDPQFTQGGLFGTFRVSDFNKDVESVISKLNVAEISPVVKMPDGSHIFKVLKKTLVPSPDLEAKREDIRRKLLSENFKRQFRNWLTQKRRDSYIRIN
ncbi:MAG: peptidylprolyl isomerase [Bdellovibrionales bacterium]|nr:peptidylprolyl isomerase [Bdellovibrionales bacterium]